MARVNAQSGKVRIIAGSHRGRGIEFSADMGIRPTHDRIRETVFNWLMHDLHDTHCLDLFSGSGALGFEAASRGASDVLMCDQNSAVCSVLEKNQQLLQLHQCKVKHIGFHPQLAILSRKPYDIVFLDPPYATDLLFQAVQWLRDNRCVHEGSLIYFETDKHHDLDRIFDIFPMKKQKQTAHVVYGLLQATRL